MAPGLRIRDTQSGDVHVCPVGRRLSVGRPDAYDLGAPRPDIACPDEHASRRHCLLIAEADALRVVDSSSFGTFINGVRVEGEAHARPGDRIVLGHRYELVVLAAGEAAEPPARIIAERYRVVRELGKGGMGVVYEAVDQVRRQPCAVKVLAASGAGLGKLAERFRREAALGAQLSEHPHIVGIYDLGTVLQSGELYCAMELVEGEPLSRYLQGAPRRELLALVAEVARAVDFAHQRGVVHRDLKPDNVLVTGDGQARLTDFGIAKIADDVAKLTATGTKLGTPHYMAPEQLEDASRAGPPADIYGLGGVLYHVLVGAPPFADLRSVRKIFQLKQAGRIPPPSTLASGIAPDLDAICLKAMRRDPEERWSSAEALAEAIEAYLVEDARPDPNLGRVIAGRYHLSQRLGAGAAGAVYLARRREGGQVALKLVRPLSSDPSIRGRFLREVAAGQAFSHPCAVRVLDSGETEDGLLFLTMDFAPGETLQARRRRLGKLPPADVQRLALQALGALHAAHQAGIVHRDLKPANLVVAEAPQGLRLRILDFGIAKATRDVGGVLSADLTGAGATMGTVRYMSPEQACGDPLDARSDLYSLATVLYELLVGEHPLGDLSGPSSALLQRVATRPARPLPPQLAGPFAAVLKNLAKVPAQRHPDAVAFARALKAVPLPRASAPPPPPSPAGPATYSGVGTIAEATHSAPALPTYSGVGTIVEVPPAASRAEAAPGPRAQPIEAPVARGEPSPPPPPPAEPLRMAALATAPAPGPVQTRESARPAESAAPASAPPPPEPAPGASPIAPRRGLLALGVLLVFLLLVGWQLLA